MVLTGLTDLVAELIPLCQITAEGGEINLSGLLDAAKPIVIAAVAERASGPVLVLAPHSQAAHELGQELKNWTRRGVAHFPALESLPYEHVRLDRVVLAEREAVVRNLQAGGVDIIVAPIRAVLQQIPSLSARGLEPVELSVGQSISVDGLIRDWVSRGYTADSAVQEPGTFARRGGVIDVFPAGSTRPVRVELFGNEIESLRSFDPVTQRSLTPESRVVISAVATLEDDVRISALEELMAVDTSSLTAEAQTTWNDDLARLEAGAALDEVGVFLPYLLDRSSTLVSALPRSASIVVVEAAEAWEIAGDLWSQGTELQRAKEEDGDLPRGLLPALVPPEQVRTEVSLRSRVQLYPGTTGGDASVDVSHLFAPARLFAGRLSQFTADTAQHVHRRIVIASMQHERVLELLREEEIPVRSASELNELPEPGATVVTASLAEGWRLPGRDIDFITDHELFGRPRTRPVRRTRAPREAFFSDFAPGDYVVHLEHGIGRFDSVVRLIVEGVEREYAVVQYAGSDRVYVPTDQLERLTRYIGVGDTPPQINRLSGGEWQRARTRARQAADEIAKELVELYAKRRARAAHAFGPDSPWQHELELSFPYPDTPDQLQAVEDVKADMEEPRPMDRLVCADVGYGKTEVAVRAAFKAVVDGKQVALLAPTTILAQQHMETFCERIAAFPIKVEALSRFRTPVQQRDILRRVVAGEVDIVIGTHRLLQKDVEFKNLGLLIVDEEQRFGVRHKEQLKKMREAIDVLTLTATPIPRTLHMGLVGIREISVIETPPEGRLPIKTYLQPYADRLVREAVLREVDREGQVYFVHNKVATIQAMTERLRRLVPEARVVVAHGQMEESQLEKVMLSFAHGGADVLLCSTIIENGLDIPNVNTIIVNNAHRLGLTQLYQLRGRVGRSASQAYAYLLYPADIRLTHDSQRRMEAVFEARELGAGMSIAMRDLEIRGVGNLLGAEQSGHATTIGFDFYTRMIADAVERMRGIHVEDPQPVTIDLPLSSFLPAEYIGSEPERLSLYRRLAGIRTQDDFEPLRDEIKDRFGAMPEPAQNLMRLIQLKLTAQAAGVTSLSLGADFLTVRSDASALFDRVSLYRRFGTEAKISTNVLRIARVKVDDWYAAVVEILEDMAGLRLSVLSGAAVGS
jgi:transcription-repair coupling factor (superfamily II helicase)